MAATDRHEKGQEKGYFSHMYIIKRNEIVSRSFLGNLPLHLTGQTAHMAKLTRNRSGFPHARLLCGAG